MKNIERNNFRRPPGLEFDQNVRANAAPQPELTSVVRKGILGLRQRRQLRKLLAYNDRTLSDIGFNRNAIRQTLGIRESDPNAIVLNNIHLQIMHPELPRARH